VAGIYYFDLEVLPYPNPVIRGWGVFVSHALKLPNVAASAAVTVETLGIYCKILL
tara:strand:+ start:270 stop:434 length:165 start_codon:yes stop_codon:yes gene_type:complete